MKTLVLLLCLLALPAWAQINPFATTLTKTFYKNLRKNAGKGVYLGHQDALAYGLHPDGTRWVGEPGRSDIHSVSGQYPAVVGFDLGRLELDSVRNLDGVPFQAMKRSIAETYARGGFSTVSWHPNNPTDLSKTSWDKVPFTVQRILHDEEIKGIYRKWLDRVAAFFADLKTPEGEMIPVVFRPFHEHTGSWFWWGAEHCTPEEYIALWQETVRYLLYEKKLNHLIIAYSTDFFQSREHYLERYPGDTYVDLLGVDTYHRNAPESNAAFVTQVRRMLATLDELAQEKAKPYAITETGLEQVTEAKWWTEVLLPALEGKRASYVLVWRNGYDKHYYAPYPGQGSASDFLKALRSRKLLLSKGVAAQRLYRP
jgi:mannan endo-1,4-beta-mannosidase